MRKTTLPAEQELLNRLYAADPLGKAEALFPGILALAQRTMTGAGIAMHMTVLVAEAKTEFSPADDGEYESELLFLIPRLILAITDDTEAQKDALRLLSTALGENWLAAALEQN